MAAIAALTYSPAAAAPSRTSASKSAPSKPAATRPDGLLQIMVSLNRQRVTVFSGGVPIMSSGVSSGQSGHITPTGIYSILQKNRYHESNIYSSAPMPFMQRITWSGIAMHEGVVPGYPASHGCIRLPGSFASSLFKLTKVGARVIVSRDPLAPRSFEHEALPRPEQKPPASDAVASRSDGTAGTFASNGLTTASLLVPASGDRTDPAPSSAPSAAPSPTATASRKPRKGAESGPVSVMISRQTGKIYVRQNFEPLYEGEITIQDPDLPMGTHVFTALATHADGTALTWNVVTFPDASRQTAAETGKGKNRIVDADRADKAAGIQRHWNTPPGAALARIAFTPDLVDLLSEAAQPGMSIIVTDRGLGSETGKGTEFVVQGR